MKNHKHKKWTLNECIYEALKYTTKIDWINTSPNSYGKAHRMGWIEECSGHMIKLGSRFKRLIYAFEFSDKSVYVGLTYNSKKRITDHLIDVKSSVYQHMNKINTIPKFIELTDYLDKEIASKKECEFLEKYEREGWIILNRIKPGGLGSSQQIWTYEKCKELALSCKTKKNFREKSESAYNSSIKNKWLSKICAHMLKLRNPKQYWTLEKCINDAKQYISKSEWKKKSYGYVIATNNKWMKFCEDHFIHPKLIWSFEKCHIEALKYQFIRDWRKNSPNSYLIAWRKKWLSKCINHMTKLRK